MENRIIGVDFDGVIMDPNTQSPIAGSLQAIEKMREIGFVPYVFTANPNILWIKNRLMDHGLDIQVSNVKVHSLLYIDDHGYRFTGDREPIFEELKKVS